MNFSRRAFAVATVAATLLACARAARADLGRPLQVAASLGDPYAQSYWAADMGMFAREGLSIRLQAFSSGSRIADAVNAGDVDIGVTTPIQIANAYLHGIPFTIVAPGSVNVYKSPGSQLVIRNDSLIRNARDLEGKIVAVNSLKTLSEVGLDAWLTANGADASKVRIVELNISVMGPALERGTIDAGIANDPSLALAIRNNGVRAVVDPNLAIAPRLMGSAWFCMKPFAEANREVVLKFARAMQQTAIWANTHRTESGDIMAKYDKIDPDLVKLMVRAEFAEELRLADIQPELDAATKFGALAQHVNATDIVFADTVSR